MTTPKERIARLVRSGSLDPAEGERLLAALSARPSRPWYWLALDPFERLGGGPAAVCGLVIALLSLAATRLGVRYDGFLDVHVRSPHSLRVAAIEQVVDWATPALLYWAFTLIMTRRARLLDFVGAAGLSRLPLLLVALPLAMMVSVEHSHRMTPGLLAIILLALACVGWHLTLLYHGFKNASGLGGAKLVVGFVSIGVLSEIASKIALGVLTR